MIEDRLQQDPTTKQDFIENYLRLFLIAFYIVFFFSLFYVSWFDGEN